LEEAMNRPVQEATTRNAFGLAGRVCVVTGGASGIGRGIAVALAAEGALVAILDRDDATETLALMSEAGSDGLAFACDASDEKSVQSACAAIRDRVGDPQVLINNAAMSRAGPLETLPLSEWNALLAVNLTGYLIGAQVFGRTMLARGEGALVHVASIGADAPIPGSGAYSVAKAGVAMLSRQLAIEWGPSGVRSNVVHPGLVLTPRTRASYEPPGATEDRIGVIPSRRIGRPDDIAQAVLFLASPRASYVNGAEVVVDGGLSRNLLELIPRADDAR
jgi:NAD(P)-dependent dehydrogenase (short-subunit alcohol dehydrogenase family)